MVLHLAEPFICRKCRQSTVIHRRAPNNGTTQFITVDPVAARCSAGARCEGQLKGDLLGECAFKSSRIYGQGWTTARKLLTCTKGVVNVEQALERNPYNTAEERARWKKGFMDGLGNPTRPFTKRGQNPWRASGARRIRAGE